MGIIISQYSLQARRSMIKSVIIYGDGIVLYLPTAIAFRENTKDSFVILKLVGSLVNFTDSYD